MTPRTLWRATGLALAAALVAATAGCGADDAGRAGENERPAAGRAQSPDGEGRGADKTDRADKGAEDGRGLGAPAHRRDQTSDRRSLVSPSPERPRGNALTVRSSGPDRHLVAADALGPRWRQRTTGDERGRVMSRCHAASFEDVGAVKVRLRDFEGPGEAVQASARFVDRRSALRVQRVVEAWAHDCSRRLERRDAALGVVRHGRWLAVVEVSDVARPTLRLRRALDAAAATF